MLENYAGMIQGGMSLVPDLLQQEMQKRLLSLQEQQAKQQSQVFQAKQAEMQRGVERQQQFQQAVMQAGSDPGKIAAVMAQFPEFSEGVKRAYDAMDESARSADLRTMSSAYSAAKNGNVEMAVGILKERQKAELAAGEDDPETRRVLAMLESGEPRQVEAALGMIGMGIAAAAGPDKFASTYGELFPQASPTAVQKEYEWRVANFGQDAADKWLATQDESLVTVEPGGSVYRKSDFMGGSRPPQPEGGDPSGSRVSGDLARMLEITVQSESGGNPNAVSDKGARGLMQVMPATGRDPGYGIRPSNGTPEDDVRLGRDYFQTMLRKYGDPAKAWAAYNAGPGALEKALAGGGDWLSRMPAETRAYVSKNMRALGGEQKPITKAEFDKLPSGATFLAPDGTVRRKP